MDDRADHTGTIGTTQQWKQPLSQGEVPHVVNPELRLPAWTHAREWAGHDASVVDQDVELRQLLGHAVGEGADRRQVREIQGCGLNLAVNAGQRFRGLLRSAHRDHDVGACRGQGPSRLQPDAAVPPVTITVLPVRSTSARTSAARTAAVESRAGGHLIGSCHGVLLPFDGWCQLGPSLRNHPEPRLWQERRTSCHATTSAIRRPPRARFSGRGEKRSGRRIRPHLHVGDGETVQDVAWRSNIVLQGIFEIVHWVASPSRA